MLESIYFDFVIVNAENNASQRYTVQNVQSMVWAAISEIIGNSDLIPIPNSFNSLWCVCSVHLSVRVHEPMLLSFFFFFWWWWGVSRQGFYVSFRMVLMWHIERLQPFAGDPWRLSFWPPLILGLPLLLNRADPIFMWAVQD